uniref:Uncharacterized protein n=1 Tax=Anguilla anguilla TaxID=7936 RepID=A0A0E9TUU5_ANGAN
MAQRRTTDRVQIRAFLSVCRGRRRQKHMD